ncbi:hypothetical protein [Vibrio vulnificus YJ016]|uniref:Uncharacterized protein n=1 Tax=Vibrio vulnificus (strain YJ016) TaxID=196600 RepID=Q7MN83_VIBVY|nr:hypothetical protein [Vibrio vulnificus YJ016]
MIRIQYDKARLVMPNGLFCYQQAVGFAWLVESSVIFFIVSLARQGSLL